MAKAKAKAGQRSIDSYAKQKATRKPRAKATRSYSTARKKPVSPSGDITVRSYQRRAWGTAGEGSYKPTKTYRSYYSYKGRNKGH